MTSLYNFLPPLPQGMAQYHSPTTLPTTFCEVTYDSDWLNIEDDRHLTPYRYSLFRNDTDSNSDTVSLTLPSYTYYEYLRNLYDCRTTPNRILPGYAVPPGSHVSQQGRSVTWHAFSKDNGSELSRQGVKSEPTKIRPTYPFPSLHLIQGGDSYDELDDEYLYADRTKEKLVWVDALNKWVPQKQLHPRPYMSFVGNAPVLEKQGKFPKEVESEGRLSVPLWIEDDHSHIFMSLAWQKRFSVHSAIAGGGTETEGVQACERFELHMGNRTSVSQPQDKSPYKQRNNEKREAIRKRAQELAEQRKQRKAYSTPLYTSMNERKQNMKPRVQSSRTHSSLPVSPVLRKDKVPSPKQVWQMEEPPKLHPVHETKPEPAAVKKEISITLVSPQPDEEEKDLEDEKDKVSEKKVTFTDESKTTAKPKKKKEGEDLENSPDADKEEEMKLQEKRLIESLEKQKQLQMLEQQKLLAEEQRKEKERKEKERLVEEERLRKMKESHNMHKQPLSTQNQNHDNYYENTMNAAGLLFSQNETTAEDKSKASNKLKTEEQSIKTNSKIESKKLTKLSTESRNNLKNSKIKENTLNTDEKVVKTPKITEKTKVKNNQSKLNETKKPQTVTESSQSPVKIMDGLKRIEEGLEREGTDDSVKVTQGKRRKGKGKTQTKQTKTEKSPRKSKKLEEEKESGNVVNSVKYVKPAKPLVTRETDNKVKAREALAKKLTNETKRSEQTHKVVPKPKPEPKPEPPSKPMLAGMGAQQKSVTAVSQSTKPEKKEDKLPVTKPSEIEPIKEEAVIKPRSPASERRKSIIEQREVVKKEKRDARKCVKKVEEEHKELPEPDIEVKKIESWIYEDVDYSEKPDLENEKVQVEAEPLPSLSADLNPELIEKEKQAKQEKRRKSVLANLLNTDKAVKKWRKPGTRDSSYADELRRLELAEERRKKQMEMFERLKNRRISMYGDAMDDGSPRFEDYGFLAKYCIFTKGNIEMYRHAFDAVDEGKGGWLEGEDVMIALRGVNNRLTEAEEEYLYRVLELTGYKLTHGADFKVFSVLAALSQRISALDKWMKNLIGQMDFKALEMKMFKCRTLWECNVDKDTNRITIDQLCVDLRAGGVSFEHEMEVREKLAHLHALDLLDFLTYIPLFIMIHESVVQNPLDDTRNK